MTKILEMIGLVLLSIMILGFVGALDTLGIDNGLTPLLLGVCRWDSHYNLV